MKRLRVLTDPNRLGYLRKDRPILALGEKGPNQHHFLLYASHIELLAVLLPSWAIPPKGSCFPVRGVPVFP